MGLASSQARLLNLTVRMHQIEYKAARLEAMKLQMANESRQVYETYLDALDRTKVQYKVINTDGSVTYRDIKSYKEDFLDAGYAIDFKGLVYDGDTYITNSSGEAIKYDSTAFEKVSLGTSDVDATTKKLTAAGLAKITSKGYTGTAYSTSTVVQVPIDIYIDKADTTKAYAGDAVKTLNFAQLCHDAFGAELDPAYTTPTLKTPLDNLKPYGNKFDPSETNSLAYYLNNDFYNSLSFKDDIVDTLAAEKKSEDSSIQVKALEALRNDNDVEIQDDTLKSQYERYLKNAKK